MNIANMPATVDQTKPHVTGTVQRRTGLIPMAVGSQHVLTLTIDGETKSAAVVARNPEDCPRATRRYLCLHERCAGKSWADEETMRAAHPKLSEMMKRNEVHVFGTWSDDPQAEGPRKIAEQALKEAVEEHDRATAAVKAAKTIGERDLAKDDKATAQGALLVAQKALAAVSGCIGLIAPADGRMEA